MAPEKAPKKPAKRRRKKPARKAAKSKGGRPAHLPTAESRDAVMSLKGFGFVDDEIAVHLGIARETLRKHYAQELDHGRVRKRAEAVLMLERSAKAGNVTAQTALVALTSGTATPGGGLRQAAAAAQPGDTAPEATGPVDMSLGKKAAAKMAARTAGEGTDWGDDLKPGVQMN
jgi:DNA-binding CsgD family transcriptional regulator